MPGGNLLDAQAACREQVLDRCRLGKARSSGHSMLPGAQNDFRASRSLVIQSGPTRRLVDLKRNFCRLAHVYTALRITTPLDALDRG
jgi:hypothetical protein